MSARRIANKTRTEPFTTSWARVTLVVPERAGGPGLPAQHDAGWSSPVARWAHNPKVGGSNPPPATTTISSLILQAQSLAGVRAAVMPSGPQPSVFGGKRTNRTVANEGRNPPERRCGTRYFSGLSRSSYTVLTQFTLPLTRLASPLNHSADYHGGAVRTRTRIVV